MTAKEMFKKLGFYVHYKNKDGIWYKEKKGEFFRNVRFNNEFKIIDLWLINILGERVDIDISIELLQAINKQVEELGWNDVSIAN
jgi:hypothetical protein